MWYYGIIQSEHCNNDNNYIDDMLMHASVCFEFFGGCDNKEGDFNWEHPLPRVLGFRRRSDIKEGDTMEVRV